MLWQPDHIWHHSLSTCVLLYSWLFPFFWFYIFLRVAVFFISFHSINYSCVDIMNEKHYLFSGFPAAPNRSPFSNPCSHSIVSIKNQNRTAEVMSWFKTKLFAYMQIYMQLHCSSWKAMKRFCVAMYKKKSHRWGLGRRLDKDSITEVAEVKGTQTQCVKHTSYKYCWVEE